MNICGRFGCLVLLFFHGIIPLSGILPLSGLFSLSAQELNAVVKVNSSMVRGANRQVFSTLEEALHSFINGRRWSDSSTPAGERIDCTFTLVVTEALSTRSFRGELYVQSHRAVENSTYIAPMLNLRDTELEFDYTEHQPLQFDPAFTQENLTAIIAYYAYLILGLDFDSRVPLGGISCFRQMELIAANVQSRGWRGWERRSNRGRSAIATALNDGSLEGYRQMWLEYHRGGIDASAESGDVVPEKVISSIGYVASLQTIRPAAVLIRLFGDAKLEEIIHLLTKADTKEKRIARDILIKLYPTRTAELERLRQ